MLRGDRLKNLRIEKNLTQTELGNMIGVKKSTISCYENGVRVPSLENLIDIIHVFGISADYLIGNDHLVIKEESEPFVATPLSKEELIFLEELKKNKFVYEIILEDPKRAAELIIKKIG